MAAPKAATFPNGCHVCEVEIDPDTGTCTLMGYVVVDDVGRVINPMLVKGQVHGGVVQGVGQILFEDIRYDEDGQLLTGSFMDYAMPRASNFPESGLQGQRSADADEPAGCKRGGRSRYGRRAGGGRQRDRGCAVAVRSGSHRDAGDAGADMAHDQGSESRARMRRRAFMPAAFCAALLVSACATDPGSVVVGEPNALPANYRADILAYLKTYLNDPTGVRDALHFRARAARNPGRQCGGDRPTHDAVERYMVCIRFNAKNSIGRYEGTPRPRSGVSRRQA